MHTGLEWWDDERIEWYERAAASSSFHKSLAADIEAMISRDMRIHEEGCGLGHVAQILSSDGYDITASDIDSRAIEEARKRSGLDIFSVSDFWGPLPPSDALLLLYFGRIAETDSIERLLDAYHLVIYVISHHRGQDTDMREKKGRIGETIGYLESKGVCYSAKDVTYSFPQPLSSMDEARRFIARMYGKENIEAFLPFLEEGHDYPYMLRNMKTSTIFAIRRRK